MSDRAPWSCTALHTVWPGCGRCLQCQQAGCIETVTEARDALDRVRAYVADPGNWSALDGRRAHILALLDGPGLPCVKKSSFGDDFCATHPGQDWPCGETR